MIGLDLGDRRRVAKLAAVAENSERLHKAQRVRIDPTNIRNHPARDPLAAAGGESCRPDLDRRAGELERAHKLRHVQRVPTGGIHTAVQSSPVARAPTYRAQAQ